MSTTRRWVLLALLAGSFAMTLLAAAPASADVDCADLKTQAAAQAYFDGRTGDPDRLDADGDGRACEGNDPRSHGTWALIALGLLFAAGLASFSTDTSRARHRQPTPAEAEEAPAPVVLRLVPALDVTSHDVAVDEVTTRETTNSEVPMPVQKNTVVANASSGSLSELARALRLVPYGERMALLERHAGARGATPQEVLDALAEHTTDLELQGWALAGYGPPWTVRVMRCSSCVDGMRNFRLESAPDGTHFWACATCHTPDRHLS